MVLGVGCHVTCHVTLVQSTVSTLDMSSWYIVSG